MPRGEAQLEFIEPREPDRTYAVADSHEDEIPDDLAREDVSVSEICRVGNDVLKAAHNEGRDSQKDGNRLRERVGTDLVSLHRDINHNAAHNAQKEDGKRRIIQLSGDEHFRFRLNHIIEARHFDERRDENRPHLVEEETYEK